MAETQVKDFPRGGAQVLTPLEARKIRSIAEKDVLFKNDEPLGKKKKKLQVMAEVKKPLKCKFLDRFSFKYLSNGLLILGYVKEFNKKEYVIGLANGLSGYISLVDIQTFLNEISASDENEVEGNESKNLSLASSLLSLGQLVPVVVKKLEPEKHGYKKVLLSILPSDINEGIKASVLQTGLVIWGMIQSIEDHGFVVSFGNKEFNGFLPKSKTEFRVGELKWFGTLQISQNKKILTVTTKHEKIAKMKCLGKSAHFASLLPGHLVDFKIDKKSENVGVGTIFGNFEAFVDQLHVSLDQEEKECINKKVEGRIIHINPKTKQVGVSLLSEIIKFPKNVLCNQHSVGDVLDECKVVRCDSSNGLLMKMSEKSFGYVHISRISDNHTAKLGKKYKAGTIHKCRVLGFSALDSVYTLTMKKSVIEKQFLSYEDLKPGMLVSGTVLTLEDFGCLVKITDSIRALCPRLQLADINLKHPEKKFVEGKSLNFRVLRCKPDERSLIVTHKKTLVNTVLPIVSSYDVDVGTVAHGFISAIKSFGLFITFFNGVKALLPKSESRLAQGANLEMSFYTGQVLQCTVISVDTLKEKMVVSLKNKDILSASQGKLLQVGEVVHGSFEKLSAHIINIRLINNLLVNLNQQHLSDFENLNEQWLHILKTATKNLSFQNLFIYEKDKKSEAFNVSLKQVVQGIKVENFKELKVGMVFGGFVSHVMSYGLFVCISPGVNGLVPNGHLADSYVSDPSGLYNLHQSLLVKVIEIDAEKNRFLLTAKPSMLLKEVENQTNIMMSTNNLLQSYLLQRKLLHGSCSFSEDKEIQVLPSLIGEIILTKISLISKEEISVTYHDLHTGLFLRGTVSSVDEDLEVGDECQVMVVDIDLSKKLFHAFTDKNAIKAALNKKIQKFQVDFQMKGTVVYVSNFLVAVVLTDMNYTLAYAYPKMHLNDVLKCSIPIQSVVSVSYLKHDDGVALVKLINGDKENTPVVGSLISAVVKGIKPSQLSVSLMNGRLNGRIHITNILDKIEEGKSPLKAFKPLQTVEAKVIGFRDLRTYNYLPISHKNVSRSLLELSLKPSVLASQEVEVEKLISQFSIGEVVDGFVTSVTKKSIWISVSPSVKGKISVLNISDSIKDLQMWQSKYKLGLAYSARVLSCTEDHLELTRLGEAVNVAKGVVLNGRISKILKHVGLLIELGNGKAGIAHITELNDVFTQNPLDAFAVDQFVRCKVLAVKKTKEIDLSLRLSRINESFSEMEEWDKYIDGYDDIKEGDILRGYVKSCSKIGVFVSISPTINGRVQIKNLSQYFVKDFISLFHVGKLVKAKVISIDPSTNHINLSLRGKDVKDVDPAPPPKRKISGSEEESSEKKKKKSSKEEEEQNANDLNEDSSFSETEVEDEDVEDTNEEEDAELTKQTLQIDFPFDWNDDKVKRKNESESEDSSDDESKAKAETKKTKRQKKAAKKAEEEFLHKAELALLDADRHVDNAEDFDRLCLGSPNSSIIWIQYMAFHLHSVEIEKARQVARKALQTISFREEQEKLNIWVALLNLESMYGTDETLDKVLQEAVQTNDPKKIYLKMLDIFAKSNKIAEAEKLYQVVLKKFKGSKVVWINYGFFLMKCGKLEEARKLLQRSLKSLHERKHIATIVQFALMEYKMGEPQRGSTILESVLKNYPKRSDLWSIYIDMTIKLGDYEQVRNIFERVTTLKMSSKKIKFMFKRYLEFEQKYGNRATIEAVRQRANDYVEMNDDE